MKIKKNYLLVLGLMALIVILAFIGFSIWNGQILARLGTLNNYSIYFILGFAFIAGLFSFFSPCGLALLPTFISYNMAMINEDRIPPKNQVVKIGTSASLGIITFFVLLGMIFTSLGSVLFPYIKTAQYIVAGLFVVFGILLWRDTKITSWFYTKFREKVHKEAYRRKNLFGYYIFGFAYGLDIIGCLFPLIAVIILLPLTSGAYLKGISTFLVYSFGLGVMMSSFVYVIATSKHNIVKKILHSSETIRKVMAGGLIAGGIFLLLYYAFFGMAIGGV